MNEKEKIDNVYSKFVEQFNKLNLPYEEISLSFVLLNFYDLPIVRSFVKQHYNDGSVKTVFEKFNQHPNPYISNNTKFDMMISLVKNNSHFLFTYVKQSNYNMSEGKHRIGALIDLYDLGMITGNTKIKFWDNFFIEEKQMNVNFSVPKIERYYLLVEDFKNEREEFGVIFRDMYKDYRVLDAIKSYSAYLEQYFFKHDFKYKDSLDTIEFDFVYSKEDTIKKLEKMKEDFLKDVQNGRNRN